MDKEFIQSIIRRFFNSNVTKELMLKFQYWLIHPDDKEAKQDAMCAIWKEQSNAATATTLAGLEQLSHQIRTDRKIYPRFTLHGLSRVAAILLLPLIGAVLSFLLLDNKVMDGKNGQLVEVIVPEGEIKQVILPDSSLIWLNSGSVLLYAGDFKGSERRLFLTGEARFEVAKDKKRPFIVKTRYMEVEALGTIFNVNAYEKNNQTNVTLEEGLVQVDLPMQTGGGYLLTPDQQLAYNHRLRQVTTRNVDARQLARWREGYMIFDKASFDDIIHAIENRFRIAVDYDSHRYADGCYSVKFMPDENIEHVFSILQILIPDLEWKRENDKIIIN